MLIGAIVFVFILCSVLVYGATFAYFQGLFPEMSEEWRKDWYEFDRLSSLKCAALTLLIGPFGLVTVFFLSDYFKHGLKFK